MNNHNSGLPLPLEGIRVLDASHIVAGPFCSLILADMGAEVIKIERPSTGELNRSRGDIIRKRPVDDERGISARFLGINRNKKALRWTFETPPAKRLSRQWFPLRTFWSTTGDPGLWIV